MNFQRIGLGLVASAVMATGVVLTEAPAQALTFGDTLVFSTDKDQPSNLATLTSIGGGQFTFDVGAIEIDTASVFGALGTNIGDNTLTLQQIATQAGALASYQLVGTSVQWLSGLNDEIGGFTRTYTLTSFILNRQSAISSSGSFSFTADFAGFFQPPTPGVAGLGGLGGSGKLFSSGAALGGDITAIPTPALLPAALGMGVAALRKKHKQEADADLASEPVEV